MNNLHALMWFALPLTAITLGERSRVVLPIFAVLYCYFTINAVQW